MEDRCDERSFPFQSSILQPPLEAQRERGCRAEARSAQAGVKLPDESRFELRLGKPSSF
jgi:hypothetical protein